MTSPFCEMVRCVPSVPATSEAASAGTAAGARTARTAADEHDGGKEQKDQERGGALPRLTACEQKKNPCSIDKTSVTDVIPKIEKRETA